MAKPISRSPTPSSTLLAILASLVGSTNAFPVAYPDSDGPPAFLCPSLLPRAEFDVQDFVLPSQTPPPSSSVPGPSRVTPTDCPTLPAQRNLRRDLAPGYTKGPDGRWRKLSTWSLYGSTICVCHDASSTADTQPMDDIASTPTPIPSVPNETDLLPPGWTRTSDENAARTILILSLSLVLAALISVFIFFLLWRRRRKRGRKDLEEKLAKRRWAQQDVESEKEHRTKAKLWTRATTRWRENVRQSARRRRNARLSNTSLHASNNSVVDLSRSVSSTHSSPRSGTSSLPPSRPSSPTPTPSTTRSTRSSLTETDHQSRNVHVEPPSTSPPSSPRPPAYQRGSHLLVDPPSDKDPAQVSSGSSLHGSHINSLPSDSPPPSPVESDLTPSNFHVAHVATDDKALLRQMEDLGSQPPTEPESSDVNGSAPILYEDDVRSVEYGDAPELVSSSVGFPLPPTVVSSSKGKAAAFECYDYDDLSSEPDPQPSAPPFEAEDSILPSAPSESEVQPFPSAPPEIGEPGDDPTAGAGLPRELGGHSADTGRPGPSRPEPLPRYRP